MVRGISAWGSCARFGGESGLWLRRARLRSSFIAMLVALVLSLVGSLVPMPGLVGSARADDATAVHVWGNDSYGEGRIPRAAEPAKDISAGYEHNVVLRTDGTVVAWGLNTSGQTTVPDVSDVIAVSAGGYHSLALKSDGTVVAWGSNVYGQASVPNGLSDVIAVSAGYSHSLALKSDGTVVAWGDNSQGQATVPVGVTGVVAVSAGFSHSLALKDDGTVLAWGASGVPDGGLSDVTAIAAGAYFSMAVKRDGTLISFGGGTVDVWPDVSATAVAVGYRFYAASMGRNMLALRDDGTVSTSYGWPPPEGLTGVVKIAAGSNNGLALKDDGSLVAWGIDYYGQATIPEALTSVKAIAAGTDHDLALREDGTVVGWGSNASGQTDVPEGLTGVTAIAAGDHHSLALKEDGTVVGWGGYNSAGSPPEGLSGVVAIATGYAHSLALRSDGTVFGWGENASIVPEGLTEVIAISAGWVSSLALKQDGTVVAWGATASPPEGLSGVAAIAAGGNHSLALKEDGTVVAWGSDNRFGQLDVPEGLSGVVAIAAGFSHSLALRSDGTVVAWGDNSEGQLDIPDGLSDVTSIAVGQYHSLAWTGSGPSAPLAVNAISAPTGGDAGNVTLTVYGTGFQTESVVKLVRAGQSDIAGATNHVVSPATGQSTINTTFDLTGEPLGVWDVVVVNPDGASAVLPGAFTIVEGGGCPPLVTADIVGPSVVRPGREASYYVSIRNESLNDVTVTVEATAEGGASIVTDSTSGEGSTAAPMTATGEANPLEIFVVPAGGAVVLHYMLLAAGVTGAAALGIEICFAIGLSYASWYFFNVVMSSDPNDIVGPGGFGEARYVRGENLLPYKVFFENKPDATAAAQQVVVTDRLDPAVFDLESFVLRGITFGDHEVVPPDGVSEFTTDVDLRPANNLIVRIEAGLDKTTGVVTWRFTSIDPETGELTEDPLAGFLPPNVTSPEGEGSVSYTVEPVEGLETGTTISNQARIVFDTNDPIDTPVWVNTLDTTDPSSQVAGLPERQAASFEVTWSGNDTGSGVQDYTVFVSEDGGPYRVWLANTTASSGTFMGAAGRTYRFFSSARDGAGNVEAYPSVPDATTIARAEQVVSWAPTTSLVTTDSPWTPDVLASSNGDGAISYAVTDAGTTGCMVDASSGVLSFGAAGACTITATAAHTDTFEAGAVEVTFTIARAARSLTLTGFIAPVDMGVVWNTMKGGATVPLKFQVFDGDTEVTDVAVIDGITVTGIRCPGATSATDAIEFTTTGGTTLRYDDGKFVQNWKTPKKPGVCYEVTATTIDGSSITANFALK